LFIHTYEHIKDWRDATPWLVATFETPRQNRSEIARWCYQTFGAPGMNTLTKQTRWKDSIQYGEVYFNRKEDLTWFLLRWA
jgi:hypothetical protein